MLGDRRYSIIPHGEPEGMINRLSGISSYAHAATREEG
jgi:hypothetical protein